MLLSAQLLSCKPREPAKSSTKFTSNALTLTQAEIKDGLLETNLNDADSIKAQIKEQLKFSIGQLAGIGATPNLNNIDIHLGHTGVREIHYSTSFPVAWTLEKDLIGDYTLILPRAVGSLAAANFYRKYGDENCLLQEEDAPLIGILTFWYYYRPEKPNCALNKPAAASDVARVALSFQKKELPAAKKSPRYQKIWEDGRLVFTGIFGQDNHHWLETVWKIIKRTKSGKDSGMAAYNDFYESALDEFGSPVESNIDRNSTGDQDFPASKYTDIHLKFSFADNRSLELNMLLVKNLADIDNATIAKYNRLSADSDLVSYNGHSGLGANIKKFSEIGQFLPGKYQIYFLNACSTFAYEDGTIQKRFDAVNQSSGPNRERVDILSNGQMVGFSFLSYSNIVLLKALLAEKSTYEDILADFDPAQRPVVTGDEDNLP